MNHADFLSMAGLFNSYLSTRNMATLWTGTVEPGGPLLQQAMGFRFRCEPSPLYQLIKSAAYMLVKKLFCEV